VALVTGAGSGMGRATAIRMAAAGARVAAADLVLAAAQDTAKQIGRRGHEALALQLDVTDSAAVRAAVQQVVERFGQLDVLANIAGILRGTRVAEIDEREWNLVVDTNLKGVFLCSQAALDVMRPRRYGRIVNMASMAGRATSTLGGAHYTAAKAGVLGLSRHLAREAAPYGITVNAISPGIVDTPMVRQSIPPDRLEQIVQAIPFQRLGTPEEIADLVVFLASSQAAYITGANVDIHGGEIIIA
jgi:NAD(P)-dependent dehydrogenase (short-subunit alcohol dehydrogenase family)